MNSYAEAHLTNSPIGRIATHASDHGLVSVAILGHQQGESLATPAHEGSSRASQIAKEAIRQIGDYLEGSLTSFNIPIDWTALSGFERIVLSATIQITFGEISTYGKLAQHIQKPPAARAVGRALGRNPMPIIIPCHRVVAANGALSGYSAADGIQTKQWLLEREGHIIVGKKLV